jgi:class 3 adenylate cyclase
MPLPADAQERPRGTSLRWLVSRRRVGRPPSESGDRPAGPAARLLLRFEDATLEQQFGRREDEASQLRGRIAAGMGAVVYALFGVLDPYVVPQDAGELVVPRVAVIAWLVVLVAALHRRPLSRLHPIPVCGGVIAVAWGLDAMAFLAPVPMSYVTGGNMMTAIALFALMGVRVRFAYPTGVLVLLGFVVTLLTHAPGWAEVVTDIVFVVGSLAFGGVAAYMLEALRRRDFLNELRLAEERARSDQLLHSILPEAIAARLRHDPKAIAEASDEVSVVFADIIGSSALAQRLAPNELVGLLNDLFCEFDAVCQRHGVEKIKTIGDAYMAVAGLPRPHAEHAVAAAEVALGWLHVARNFAGWPGGLDLRVGISSGPVVAGVIGQDKFAYDLWGDTVNTASRMESQGHPGRVQVSETTRRLLAGRYGFSEPMQKAVKGKGVMTTYLLLPAR